MMNVKSNIDEIIDIDPAGEYENINGDKDDTKS